MWEQPAQACREQDLCLALLSYFPPAPLPSLLHMDSLGSAQAFRPTYNDIMENETLKRRFQELLPFCMWCHLSATPTCLPVLCLHDRDELKTCTACLYKRRSADATLAGADAAGADAAGADVAGADAAGADAAGADAAGADAAGDLAVVTVEDLVILSSVALVGFAFHTDDTIVYSGATTATQHAQILAAVLVTENLKFAWMHYDVHLMRAVNALEVEVPASNDDSSATLRDLFSFELCRDHTHVSYFTNVQQELENLEAMHRQLPLMDAPVPLDFTGVLGGQLTDVELTERARAFRRPQLVRPVVGVLQNGHRLCAHFVNLAPHGSEDVRLASPMARAPSIRVIVGKELTYVPGTNPGCFNGDVIRARLVVNSASGFSSSHWRHATEAELESSSTKELVNANLKQALQHGEFMSSELVAELPYMSSPMYARDIQKRPYLPGSSTVAWLPHASGASPDIAQCSPAGKMRLVDGGALLHKQPCAYAKRLTRLGCIGVVRACGHFGEVRVAPPHAGSPWTDEDVLESLLWRQRVGWPFSAFTPNAQYFLNVPSGYHFFRTLWVRESDDVVLLLPLYNFVMLRGHAGTCVPLHWKEGDGENKYANLRSLRFARSAVKDDVQLLQAFDAVQALLVSLIGSSTVANGGGGAVSQQQSEYVRSGGSQNSNEFRYDKEHTEHTLEDLKKNLPVRAWFSDPVAIHTCDWCGKGAQAIWCTEWLLRRLFLRQMRRICEEKGLSAKSVDLMMDQFDEAAGWPAFDVGKKTYFVYTCCATVKDDTRSHVVDMRSNGALRTVVDREAVLSDLSDADETAVQNLIRTYDQEGDRVDRMSLVKRSVGEGKALGYFMAFSAYYTDVVVEYNDDTPTPFIVLRCPKSVEPWPLCYYARGAEFLATNSFLDDFCRDPSDATYLKALPILKIICAAYDDRNGVGLVIQDATAHAAQGAFAKLVEHVVDVTTHKLAFLVARSDPTERKGLFVLELYDADDTLCGAAVVARLVDSSMADGNMTLNCLELVAVYGKTDSGGQPAAYKVDQALRALGCGDACADDTIGAIRSVLEHLAACWRVECLVRAPRHAQRQSGLDFLGRPFPYQEQTTGSVVLYAKDHEEKRQHVVRSRAAIPTKWPTTKKLAALPTRADRHGTYELWQFYLFAAPLAKTQRLKALSPAERGAPSTVSRVQGTYCPTGLVFHGGVCEMLADGVEPVALERAPTFTRCGDASIECDAAVLARHGSVTDHGPPTARPIATDASVDLARLISRHQGDAVVCVRVCFEDARGVMSHLRACHTHAVVLSVYGAELTTLPKLTLLGREPVLGAFREYARDGAFGEHAPWDRRFAFVGGDGVVFGVVLLHVGTTNILTGLHTTVPSDVAHQPGSYVCRAGGQVWFPAAHARRPTVGHAIEVSDDVFYNTYLGDKWVLGAAGAVPPSGKPHARSYAAVNGRAWDGKGTRSWTADAVRLDTDGRVGWNCGAFQCVTPGKLAGDIDLLYEDNGGFRLFRTRERFSADAPRTDVPSTRAHVRCFLGDPLTIDDSTERVTIYLGPRYNATIRVFVLLQEPTPQASEALLAARIRQALHTSIGAETRSFEVDACCTRLTAIGDMPARESEDELVAKAVALHTVAPLAFERASGHFLVPGHAGPVLRCLVEVRIGVDVSDEEAASHLRSGAVVGVQTVFPQTLSIASAVENRYVSIAVTLLNRRAATLEHLAALVTSDIGRHIQIRDGVLEVDGRERAASWVDIPGNVDGVIVHLDPWTDAAVVVQTAAGKRLVPNPSRSFRASSQTVEQLFTSLIRVALARCRQ